MKSILKLFPTVILTVLLLGFESKHEIGQCYISFNTATNLTGTDPDRLPEISDKDCKNRQWRSPSYQN